MAFLLETPPAFVAWRKPLAVDLEVNREVAIVARDVVV
jgi:hypothetical protein